MAIELKITAETTEKLRQYLTDLLFADGASVSRNYTVQSVDTETVAAIMEHKDAASRSESPEAAHEKKEPAKKARAKKDQPSSHSVAEDAANHVDAGAQVDSTAPQNAPLTHDNVRNVLGVYVKKFGMEAAQADGPRLIASLFGEGKGKVSDIPDTQEALAKAVAGIEELLAKNTYNRKDAA